MALFNNGRYRIVNVEYGRRISAELYGGGSFGAVIGARSDDSAKNQKWDLVNFPGGNNQVTLQSVSTPSAYAGTYSDQDHSPVVGSPHPTVWTIKPATPQADRYHILVPKDNDGVAWYINRDGGAAAIVLRPTSSWDSKVHWRFEPIE